MYRQTDSGHKQRTPWTLGGFSWKFLGNVLGSFWERGKLHVCTPPEVMKMEQPLPGNGRPSELCNLSEQIRSPVLPECAVIQPCESPYFLHLDKFWSHETPPVRPLRNVTSPTTLGCSLIMCHGTNQEPPQIPIGQTSPFSECPCPVLAFHICHTNTRWAAHSTVVVVGTQGRCMVTHLDFQRSFCWRVLNHGISP